MGVTVSSARLIGTRVVPALRERGTEVTVFWRPEQTHRALGVDAAWNTPVEPAPAERTREQ
jgi:formate-dependent phosphoribosylglycinamide formyltransferase (GAR transformylase)